MPLIKIQTNQKMLTKSAIAYSHNDADTAVASFGSVELIVLIYDRVIDHLRVAKYSVENRNDGFVAFNKAHDLIQQGLLACLDRDQGVGIAENLNIVYEWSLREILAARLDKNVSKLDEVIRVLSELRGAWTQISPAVNIPEVEM